MLNLRVFSFFPQCPPEQVYLRRTFTSFTQGQEVRFKEDLNTRCLLHYSNASDLKCTKCMSLQTGVCWWFLSFIRYRMKTEQLCKLHMKYLQQLQCSSIGNKSFERCRKQKMLYAKGRVAMGGGMAIASDMLGSREAPLLSCRWRDGKGGEP